MGITPTHSVRLCLLGGALGTGGEASLFRLWGPQTPLWSRLPVQSAAEVLPGVQVTGSCWLQAVHVIRAETQETGDAAGGEDSEGAGAAPRLELPYPLLPPACWGCGCGCGQWAVGSGQPAERRFHPTPGGSHVDVVETEQQ